MEIHTTNVNQALSEALHRIKVDHIVEPSRNGDVWVFPEPVTTYYEHPWERVLFSPMRNANPWLHMFDALWCLAGRNDVEFLTFFAKNFANYSDNGKIFHGAYGYRWRTAFLVDQLDLLAEMLAKDATTRRAVLGMWSPHIDLGYAATAGSKDVPCNTHVYFSVRDGRLDMTVCNRSNDLWLGCYGANAVQFSMLQELLAAYAGYAIGEYRQFSNNLHLYTSAIDVNRIDEYAIDADEHDHYLNKLGGLGVDGIPMVEHDAQQWLRELAMFFTNPLNDPPYGYTEPFFLDVVIPMYRLWWRRKTGAVMPIESLIDSVKADDWSQACYEWWKRADAKKAAKVGS